jgi:hypothetical protein
MKYLHLALVCLAATLLVGCKSTNMIRAYKAPPQPLSRDAKVFIGLRPDAYDEPGSGMLAIKTLQKAFEQYARTELAEEPIPAWKDLTNAVAAKCTYLLDTTIVKWEEEPTEWTGKSDVLDMKLRLLQVPDGKVVSEAEFEAKSKWATFGGDRVEHLLAPLASGWVRALYEGGEFVAPGAKTGEKPK